MSRMLTQKDIDNFKLLSAMDMADCMTVEELSDLQDRIRVSIIVKTIRNVKDRVKFNKEVSV